MKERTIELPKTVEVWKRPDSPKVVDASNIFQYMDGAGELYLGYRFKKRSLTIQPSSLQIRIFRKLNMRQKIKREVFQSSQIKKG